jgi:hypothetical protein
MPLSTPTVTQSPCAITFTDVLPTDYFYEHVRCLYCRGAISGYADNTFRPYNNITRGQTCKIVVIAFEIPINTQNGPHFTDVPPDHPFYEWVETAYNEEIVAGYDDGTFRPYNNVTRGQLVKIVCNAAGWTPLDPPTPTFIDVPPDHPFYAFIEAAVCRGVITGYNDGTFRPANSVIRAQAAKIICLAVEGAPPCGTPTRVTGRSR